MLEMSISETTIIVKRSAVQQMVSNLCNYDLQGRSGH